MFFEKNPAPFHELLPAAGGKVAASSARGSSPSPAPQRRKSRRPLKIVITAAILGTGVAATLSGHGRIASNNAVISTNLISLRTPIEGIVSRLPKRVGEMITRGALIARMENPRVNDQPLVDLRAQLTRLDAEIQGAKANRTALLTLQSELVSRAALHTKVNSERLRNLVDESEKTLSALAAKQDQAQNDVDRRLPLEASGIVAKAQMYRLRSALETTRQETAAQIARLAALRTEAEAAAQGVLTGTSTGGTDKSYSAQRADEIEIQLSSLDKTIGTLTAEAKETKSRLEAEQQRIDLFRSADIIAPSTGMIWRLGAADGERLGLGDMAAEIVDCNAPFLLAAIPQDRFSDVEVGGTAHFRLSGERTERTGMVVSVTGHGDMAKDDHYAVMPLDEPSTVIVTIAMPSIDQRAQGNTRGTPQGTGPDTPQDLHQDLPQECLIGRSARVLLPAMGGGFTDQILRRVF